MQGNVLLSHFKALTPTCLGVVDAPDKAILMSLLHAFRWPARSASLEPKQTLCQAVRGQGASRQAV